MDAHDTHATAASAGSEGAVTGDQAHNYIAMSSSEEVATRITMHIVASVRQLAAFPMSGRPGRVPGTRELVISNAPFIAAYTIENDRVVILAIYHGAQQWPAAF
jgi:toxin ParE1/3/4